jgi:hypothetical protein
MHLLPLLYNRQRTSFEKGTWPEKHLKDSRRKRKNWAYTQVKHVFRQDFHFVCPNAAEELSTNRSIHAGPVLKSSFLKSGEATAL